MFNLKVKPVSWLRNSFYIIGAILFVALSHPTTAQTYQAEVLDDIATIGGTCSTTVQIGNTLYVGGSFSAVSPRTGPMIRVNGTTGDLLATFPNFNDQVQVIESDGNGGYYVGGIFTMVGTTSRRGLVHLLADNSIDMTFPEMQNLCVNCLTYTSMQRVGTKLYLTGNFQLGNSSHFAEIDLTTNTQTSLSLNFSGILYGANIVGNSAYIYGTFSMVNGESKGRVAKVNLTTGQLEPLNVTVSGGDVMKAIIANGKLYLAGTFSTVNGTTRHKFAEVDLATETVTAIDGGFNTSSFIRITDMELIGSVMYFVGGFTTVKSTSRTGLAAIDLATDQLTSFGASHGASSDLLHVVGNNLYVGGFFSRIGTTAASYMACYDLTTGNLKSFNPRLSSTAFTVLTEGSNLVLGGQFIAAGGVVRNNACAIDLTTNQLTSWNPDVAGQTVISMLADGSTIYLGGAFTSVGGQPRTNFAAVNSSDGAVTSLIANATGTVNAIAMWGNKLIVGGNFGNILSTPRTRLAMFDKTTATLESWSPTANSFVFSIVVDGNSVYVGGQFTLISSTARSRMAKISLLDGSLASFNPDVQNGVVNKLLLVGTDLYVGGTYNSIFGQTRNALASINTTTGLLNSLNAGIGSSSAITNIVSYNGLIFFAGYFSTVGGQTRNHAAFYDPVGMAVTSWATPSINGTPYSAFIANDHVYMSFSLTTLISNKRMTGLVKLSLCGTTPVITAAGPTTFCSGGSVVLQGPANRNYLWSNGATTQNITVTQAGVYTLQTTLNGCTTAASNAITVTIDPCPNTFSGIGNWSDVTKWSFGTLPTATDSAIIATGSTVTMNTTAVVRSLLISAGATMNMNTTSDLTVTNVANNLGTVNNTYGTTGTLRLGGGSFPTEFKGNRWNANRVILLSNAKANGPLHVFSGLDLNGKTFNVNNKEVVLRFGGVNSVSAELLQPAGSAMQNANSFRVDKRYPISLSTTGTNGGAWILVGAPVSNQNVNTWSQGNFYAYSWQNGIYNGSSIYTYDPFYTLPLSKGYKKPVNGSQAAPIGVGHRVWFRYVEFFTIANMGGQSYTGTPHIGSFNWNLQYCVSGCADTLLPNTNTGYNMISNPFAATIDWDAPSGWTRNNVYNAMYIHKSLTQNVASYVNGVGNNGGSRYLPVGQGFFVWADAPGANMTATPAVIAPGQQVAHLRTGQTADVLRFNVSFNNGIADEAVIRFDQRATPLFDDQLEARKMSNFSGLNFAFLNANNERIAINAENFPTAQTTYPLSLAVPRTGNYTIDFNGMATLTNSNWSVFLKDNDLNTLIPVQDGQGYSFNQSAGSTTRFSLVVMPQGPTSLGNQVKLALNIVPNPGRDVVRVNLSQTTNGLITVTNQIGQVVMSEMVSGNSHDLNISTLAKGIYHVAVGGVVTKLVVE